MGESFDFSEITSFFKGVLPVRLVVVRTIIIIIVPLDTSLLLRALSLLAPVFNPTTCISAVDDIAQIAVISITPSVALLWWSDAAGRVPTGTLPVVKLVIPDSVFAVVNRVNYSCCIQHRLETLDMCVDFFVILG
jgi:hypothetical protein